MKPRPPPSIPSSLRLPVLLLLLLQALLVCVTLPRTHATANGPNHKPTHVSLPLKKPSNQSSGVNVVVQSDPSTLTSSSLNPRPPSSPPSSSISSSSSSSATASAWRKLHITKDALILESRLGNDVVVIPRSPLAPGQSLQLQKQSKTECAFFPSTPPSSSALAIEGVYGFFDLPSGPYLAVITDSEEKYRGHGMEFRLVTKVTLVRVSYAGSSSSSSSTSSSSSSSGSGKKESDEEEVKRTEKMKKQRKFPTVAAMLGDPEEEEVRKEGGKEGKEDNDDDDDDKDEEDEDVQQLELLRLAFRTHDLYFSHTCDVTLTAQRRADLLHPSSLPPSPPSFPSSLLPEKHNKPNSLLPRSLPLWQRADDRFFWNRPLLQPLIDASAHEWVLPVMSAYVQAARNVSLSLGGREGGREGGKEGGTLVLISRRSCRRQGRRFVKRGIDEEGNTANFVETEQIFVARGGGREGGRGGGMTSFVQIRGSIPLRWSSPANLKYTPPVHVEGTVAENVRAMGRHYGELLGRYGEREGGREGWKEGQVPVVMMVNLIDKKKAQGRLGLAWEYLHALVMAALSDKTASRAFLPPSLPPSLLRGTDLV